MLQKNGTRTSSLRRSGLPRPPRTQVEARGGLSDRDYAQFAKISGLQEDQALIESQHVETDRLAKLCATKISESAKHRRAGNHDAARQSFEEARDAMIGLSFTDLTRMGSLMGDQDAAFHDAVACELVALAGTKDIRYFALLFDESPKDALYGEPIDELHERDRLRDTPGKCISGFLTYPERTIRSQEEGQINEYDATVWIARKAFESVFQDRDPQPGDVVEAQDKFYDVIGIEMNGQYNDTIAVHAGWLLKLKSRSQFDARRRIET